MVLQPLVTWVCVRRLTHTPEAHEHNGNHVETCACRSTFGTLADLDEADDDDEAEGQELGGGEEVLHPGGRLHTVAVHEGQQH